MGSRNHKPSSSRMVIVNGREFSWTPAQGLDPRVALEVEGFIRKKAWGYSAWARTAGLEFEDLVQEGLSGALKAAAHFNPDAGAKYLTYACPWIESAMKDALNQRTVRTPNGISCISVCSLDATLSSGNDQGVLCLLDFQVDDQPSAQELIAICEERARVRAVLYRLTSKERRLLVAHLGLDGRNPETMPAVAKSLGLSRQGAAQVMESALAKLRFELAG